MRKKLGENEKPSLLAYIVNNLRFRCKVKKNKIKNCRQTDSSTTGQQLFERLKQRK